MMHQNNNTEKELFKIRLAALVRGEYGKTIYANGKIDYVSAGRICDDVRQVFLKNLGMIPLEIEAVCKDSREVLSSARIFRERAKKAFLQAIALVIGGGMALFGVSLFMGWGVGWLGKFLITLFGHPILAPACWIAGGVFLVILTSFFFHRTSGAVYMEKFERALTGGLSKAIDALWPTYGNTLEKMVKPSVPAQEPAGESFYTRFFHFLAPQWRKKESIHG